MFIGSFVMLFFTHGPIETFLQLGLDFLLADSLQKMLCGIDPVNIIHQANWNDNRHLGSVLSETMRRYIFP